MTIELDPLLAALARADVPPALGAIEPGIFDRIAVRREASIRRRALAAVTVAALGLGAFGGSLPRQEKAPDLSLGAPLALAPSSLLAAES